MKRINNMLFIAILILALIVPALPMSAQGERTLATVNGFEITLDEFYDTLEDEFGVAVLEMMIIDELVRQKQQETGVEVDEADFQDFYGYFVAQVGGPEALYMFLRQNNMTEDQLIDQLHSNLLISTLAMSEVSVTEDEVAEWYEENKDMYVTQEAVEVSHILVDTEEEAVEILDQLEAGADFAAIAQEKSIDAGTAINGGELGLIPRGFTVEPFEELAFSLTVGEMGITESQFGWHIILVHARQEEKMAELNEIYDVVEQDLVSSLSLSPNEYILKLEQEASIEITHDKFQINE